MSGGRRRTDARELPVEPGSLAGRLTRLALLAAALALLVAGSALNVATYLLSRQALAAQSAEQARVLAANLSAALAFGDRVAAQEVLQSLEGLHAVERAQLRDAQGSLVAEYRRADLRQAPASSGAAAEAAPDAPLMAEADVQLDGRRLGDLTLQLGTDALVRRGLLFGVITLGVVLVALGMAWLLAVGVRRDVSQVERRLDNLAHRDPVTGLFNRHAAMGQLARLVDEGQRRTRQFSLISIDLDDFKLINDTLGHAVGDAVLVQVARRLEAHLPAGALAYRLGGDEFIVICPDADLYADPAGYHQMTLAALAIPPLPESPDLLLSGSVGVARFPLDAQDVASLLQASDIAMYVAKQRGKNQIAVYEPEMRERTEAWVQTANDLRGALRRGELRLHYQPIVSLPDRRIVGAEALVRWEHPQRGWLLPGDFMHVAERSGLIADIGGWVMDEAARQWVRWRDMGLGELHVAVNVSPRQLRRGLLQQQFDHAIAISQADAAHITLELTEHSLVEHLDDNHALLLGLRARGVQVAIDDFGTGLSSLSYLKRLPVSQLKIDRSFVGGLSQNDGDATIVGATLAMARAFGLQVVAEGVEDEVQCQALVQLGCDFAQGYLFSRPLSAVDFEQLLRSRLAVASRSYEAGDVWAI